MRITTALTATFAVAAAAAVGILGTPIAVADDLTTTTIGNEAKLTDGDVVQSWTVTDLKASTDQIPYPVAGTLWEATATDQAIQGSATPIVSNLNARTKSGATYRVLFGVATPQGVSPATLAQGQKTTGKVYFDVVGDTPDSVVYNAGGQDLLVWVQPPPQLPAQRGGGSYSSTSPVSPSTPTTTTAPTTPTPTPTPGAVPGAPAALPPGSAGTPLPAGSQGTPLAPATPAPAAGTEGAPQPAAVQQAPAATGSQGTPLPTGASASAAPSTTVIAPPPPA
ncbi:hypothetical protein TUM20985_06900 [Mycobacterium antarcticum]|uniref:MPT63 family protein n=1 Tax=unclassified Mycolicibacterium TaxID=2636767 RepID=UPI00239A8409|nr:MULTISPECIES: MPT63 family protein [unclassified Mycolicibacterium]BDX30143.1 hypothetical protein TUM20985_06900 [Mycolicibacterium sp. TUM20985]GLP73601.1 hypothetical protein TUM20983_07110 [Mycolicibacterium sp. TUM20983]GLP79279.1 hypothetical protein TUM20984_06990 [Mycolicibacterium sp. TUM20984]